MQMSEISHGNVLLPSMLDHVTFNARIKEDAPEEKISSQGGSYRNGDRLNVREKEKTKPVRTTFDKANHYAVNVNV